MGPRGANQTLAVDFVAVQRRGSPCPTATPNGFSIKRLQDEAHREMPSLLEARTYDSLTSGNRETENRQRGRDQRSEAPHATAVRNATALVRPSPDPGAAISYCAPRPHRKKPHTMPGQGRMAPIPRKTPAVRSLRTNDHAERPAGP